MSSLESYRPTFHTAERPRTSESGDTLIEILIAIVIIALTVTGLLSGLITALTSATTEQDLSTVDAVLDNFAQAAQSEVQQPGFFKNCTMTEYRLISAPMPSSGPRNSTVTVFVTGFAPSSTVTASLGSTNATVVNGSKTDQFGDAAVTFLVPSGASGTQPVSISDGTATASPTAFTVSGNSAGSTPEGYSVSVDPVQQWDSQAFAQNQSPWVLTSSPNCPNSGTQLLTVVAKTPKDTAGGSLSFVASGAAATTVRVDTSSTPTRTGGPLVGDKLMFIATIVPPNSSTTYPNGSVTWSFSQSPNNPSCDNTGSTMLTDVPNTNEATAECVVDNSVGGTYTATPTYNPGNYAGGAGSGSITVGPTGSSTIVSVAPSPVVPGAEVTFTATVGANPPNPNDPKPSGLVTWSVNGPSGTDLSCASVQMPAGGLGTNTATCLVQTTVSGTYSASAAYGGDTNYTNAAKAGTSVDAASLTPTMTWTPPSNPLSGSPMMIEVTVNSSAGITPTGMITWGITPPQGTPPSCTPSTLDNTGSALCTIASPLPGPYVFTATFVPGGANANSFKGTSESTTVAVALTPAGFDIQTAGNGNGEPERGESIVFTYNQPMSAGSIDRNWNGTKENVIAQFARVNGQTQMTVCVGGGFGGCNTGNLGTVALGDNGPSHYTGNVGTVSVNATMTMSANGAGQSVVTVTLNQVDTGLNTVPGTTTLKWTPSNAATNKATPQVACSTTPVNELGSPKANF